MKNRSLKIVGVFFLIAAVFLTVSVKKTPETKTTTTEVREVVKTARPPTNKPSQEIVEVVYSTKAFLNKGTPETEQQ